MFSGEYAEDGRPQCPVILSPHDSDGQTSPGTVCVYIYMHSLVYPATHVVGVAHENYGLYPFKSEV